MAPTLSKHFAGSANSGRVVPAEITECYPGCKCPMCRHNQIALARSGRRLAPALPVIPAPKPPRPEVLTMEQAWESNRAAALTGSKAPRKITRRKDYAAQAAAEQRALAAFKARLSPPPPVDLSGGDNPLGCPDLPRSKASKMMRDERDDHPKSTDWQRPAVARWHDAYDAMLMLWGSGRDIPVVDFPAEAVKILADPGILADKVVRGTDGEILDKITYRIAFIRVEDEKIIPLDDSDIRSEKDPYPGWDYQLQGDPEQGKRLGTLTKRHGVLIGIDQETAHLSHEQSRALFNSQAYRAKHPELDGYRAATREQWRRARKRAVEDGLMHKPEPDQHYRQGRRWHTISMPYAPGPAPETPGQQTFIRQDDRRLIGQVRRTMRRLTGDETRQRVAVMAGRSAE